MKKWIALLMTLIVVLSMAACGGGKETGKEADQTSASAAKEEEQAAEQSTAQAKGFEVPEVPAEKRVSDLVITELNPGKEKYAVGETVTAVVKWTGTPDTSCWVGIIPADIPHGDEYVNDEADLSYIYLYEQTPGEFTFDIELEAGSYTLRVNENDDGGAELAWCAFTVQ